MGRDLCVPENDLNDATMTAHKYSVMASAKKTAQQIEGVRDERMEIDTSLSSSHGAARRGTQTKPFIIICQLSDSKYENECERE